MESIVSEFVNDYMQRRPYSTQEEITDIVSEVLAIEKKNSDKSLEELIDAVIADDIMYFEGVRKEYGVPGYTTSIKVNNLNIKFYGGNISHLGEELPENALFDIASMTKFYTHVIAHNLIRDGVFKREDRIHDLNPRFKNLTDLTVDEILTFGVDIKTAGDIKDKKTQDEAYDALFNATIGIDKETGAQKRGSWVYTDVGLMIMKEVMEKLTGLTYPELVDKYIIYPLHLTNTHVIVPKTKVELITGTPNIEQARINDLKANYFNGYSGHAGIFASSDDVIRLLIGARNEKILPNYQASFTPGKYKTAIAEMGSNYLAHPKGLEVTFVEKFEPNDTLSIAGSTRVNAASTNDSAYTIMYNPASIDIEKAKEIEKMKNEERKRKAEETGKEYRPLEIVREFPVDVNGDTENYTQIDVRQILPLTAMEQSVSHAAKATLKLRFLDFLERKINKAYANQEEINYVNHTR